MEFKELKTIEDFRSVQKGDWVACEFKEELRYDYPEKPYKLKVFKVYQNLINSNELVLQRKNNMYVNYGMFVEGKSYLKNAVLISLGKEADDE